MRRLLGRIGEWSVTHPAAAIAGVVSVVAIVGVIGALRLSPDAGTDKLVDNGSAAFEGTRKFRERFGDDAIVVLAEGDLKKLMLTDNIDRLLGLETCLAGTRPTPSGQYAAEVCQEIARPRRDPGRLRPGDVPQRGGRALQPRRSSIRFGRSGAPRRRAAAGCSASFRRTGLSPTTRRFRASRSTTPSSSPRSSSTRPGPAAPPKSKFGYLFPSRHGALISIRLQPGISEDDPPRGDRADPRPRSGAAQFELRDGSYEISGIPVVVQGLADELGGQIALLFARRAAGHGSGPVFAFGPPLRLLPLFIALGSAGDSPSGCSRCSAAR